MSKEFINDVLYSLQRDYGCKIELYKIISGDIDFTSGSAVNNKKAITIDAIDLPVDVARQFFRPPGHITFGKRVRQFIILTKHCPESWVKNGEFIGYLGVRYNIVESSTVENCYHHVIATAQGVNDP